MFIVGFGTALADGRVSRKGGKRGSGRGAGILGGSSSSGRGAVGCFEELRVQPVIRVWRAGEKAPGIVVTVGAAGADWGCGRLQLLRHDRSRIRG